MRRILPTILALITGRDRYFPEVEWARNSWTHNAFRVFEMVFGRAFGPGGAGDVIRAECSVEGFLDEDGLLHVTRQFFTLEAVIAHVEGMVRTAWAKLWEPRPEYGFMPQPVFLTMMVLGLKFSFHGDLNGFMAPLIGGAIAYDNSAKSVAVTTALSFSLTTSGSNRLLIMGGQLQDNSRSWSSMTYAGNATTQIGSNIIYSANSAPGQLRYQIAPTTGANNAVFTPSGSINTYGIAVSYTGCKQSGQPDGTAQGSGSTSQSVTVTATGCWMVSLCVGFNNDFATPGPSFAAPAGVITTLRQFTNDGQAVADSNGTISTGSQSYQWSGLNSNNGRIAASIAPAPAAGPVNMKSLDGNLSANIKSFCGNLIANVKSIAGNS